VVSALSARTGFGKLLRRVEEEHRSLVIATRGTPKAVLLSESADAAQADYLVTGIARHFPKFWKKTKVITSREFIDIVAPHLIP